MSSYVTAADDIYFSDNNASSAWINCPQARASGDAVSLDHSDNASSNQRGVKMSTIASRVGEALSRKRPSLNFGSRFKEDFQTSSIGPGRRSLKAKINHSVPRRSKYSSTSFSTAPSRRFSSEESQLALGCANSIGVRLEASIGTFAPLRGDEGSFAPSEVSPATLARVYDYQAPLGTRQSGLFEPSRLTPHSELLPDETQPSSRGILQQWTTNIHGAFSSNTTLRSQSSKAPKRLTKLAPDSGEVSIVNTDIRQLPSDAGRPSIPAILLPEPVSRFRPGKLGKAVKSGLRKLMSSHDNGRQAQLFQLRERRDENIGPKVVRTDTQPWTPVTMEAADYGTVSPKQHLSVELRSCCPPSATQTKKAPELARPPYTAKSAMQVGAGQPAQGSCSDDCAGGALTTNVLIQSHIQPEIENGKDEELASAGSVSVMSDVRVLRRCQSALDVPRSRNLALTWAGRSMVQSLSLGNLRA